MVLSEAESVPGTHVGRSPGWRQVLEDAALVGPTETTVLVGGETGTGKELVARAVHAGSRRKGGPFVPVNCGLLTGDLIASELFGHERGAFTGALERKPGRVERAAGGTLFLDEIGDLTGDLQVRLLRFLQAREYERVGGTQTFAADVRIIAATNRDLGHLREEGRFRDDLYFRLNVFPIRVPPLRDRREDVEPLLRHFVDLYSKKIGKRFSAIDRQSLLRCEEYPWPGNVRELENFIERSVILSRGPNLRAPLAELRTGAGEAASGSTLSEVERDYILRVFRETGGVVSTTATRLGMPRTTLNAMMKKLRISRSDL